MVLFTSYFNFLLVCIPFVINHMFNEFINLLQSY